MPLATRFDLSVSAKSRPFNSCQLGKFFVPTSKVILVELIEMTVTAGAGHNLHKLNTCLKEVRKTLRRSFHIELFA